MGELRACWQILIIASLQMACLAQPETPPDLDLWIGQMLIVGFRGMELGEEDPFLQELKDLHLGGVILFDYDVPARSRERNIESAEQVRALTRSLQQASEIPLFIAIDQEGGRIARLKPVRGFPATQSQATLGTIDEEAVTRANAARIAETLAELGFNLNFAPVLDLALNPENPVIAGLERSYGADPQQVVRQARWTIEEFHLQSILSSLKHFPGHGSSREDSHLGLPDVSQDWQTKELEPFRQLIQEGLADSVMTAHIFNSAWDEKLPATLSPAVITGLLREELGFEGVIISDDMQMGAIVEHYSFAEGIRLGIEAGLDILVISNNQVYDPAAPRKAVRIIRRLVEEGTIPAERIQKSYQRIQKLKTRLR